MKQLLKPMAFCVAVLFAVSACSDNGTGMNGEEDNGDGDMNPSELSVEDQGTSNGNQVTIPSLMIEESGWVVIHRDADGGPQVPDIIGKAMVDAGANSDVSIQLEESVSDGETLWAMLHQDTGAQGEYEFTGSDSPDQPVTVNGEILTKSFVISQTDPAVMSEDQVNKGGVFATNVDAAEDGWIVIHRSNSAGDGPQVPEIIAKTQVSAGSNTDVFIPLNDGETVEAGETLWPMLHYDTGTKGEYEFDGSSGLDQPVLFDGNIVLSSFTVLENQSTLTAMDQTLMDNSISVDVDASTDGWVVVHRTSTAGDGPMVPAIIGKTKIDAGMNEDVMISFGDSVVTDGEQLWPMVHFDTGVKGEYEFDGTGTQDLPMIIDGSILMTPITVSGSTASVVANDQAADSDIAIAEANAMQRGFVVIHRNTQDGNGNDAPDVSGIIGKTDVYTGTNGDLTINLDEGESIESGEKLWAMLHIDSNSNGSYDFDANDENPDDPPVFDSNENIVMVQFTLE
ncbi:hypothetical protein NC796_08705 [Aliifodinibius sp. S!AR15-10]|uniref:DUF7282 domain-containing protein n=1 Tax=Aliifodinibius sp. S!AR15-10 TaxID=2950437 RepID=UPI00285B1223|nr:hypothetical protein [Aliifodinibius sp. S!AR15-10]MDR8391215.1 hypothetical protein [Aliifodinibius sp. S!AR15-10]